MKSALVIALAASLVAAQDTLNGIPDCAKDCVAKYVTGSGVAGCMAADIGCVCRNKDFLNSIACCLASVCSQADQDKTVQFATQLCSASGVQVPSKVECNNGASSSGSTSGSGSASSTAASKTTGTAASGSASGTATGASHTSSSTGAAVPVVGSVGGLAGAVLAMLAVL
ncbi:hypothetical protein TOPH_00041 [Tolypocladium ophioglossoides CBS 100239]|uniref:CFEM domain-containing protein n=1 Tax=Tolypocladium ophioglossoides (strain CBS 100239) TaxID=1163406 RepID=A0A0L0NM97_TOLOC|nr:hypothetical protein TOPH_00041 [Tolypocladium ophioglossoides CBS 100239]